MKTLNTLLALSFLMVSACAEYEPNKNNQAMDAQTLETMPISDALAKKYESASLNCKLWIRMKEPIVVTDTPDDQYTVDLLKDSSFPKTASLSAKTETHSLAIQIYFADLSLQTFEYDDNFGEHYVLRNSPVINARYSGQSKIVYSETQSATQTFKGNGLTLNENIVNPLIASSSGSPEQANQIVNYVECSIATKAKPE